MNKRTISRTKIDWCTHVWNPLWGCENNCPYCYARIMAQRFGRQMALNEYQYSIDEYDLNKNQEYLKKLEDKLINFKPTLLKINFDKKFPQKSSVIFVNSMSDIGYWWDFAIQSVLKKIEYSPEHVFVFLTKQYNIYKKIIKKHQIPCNVILGYTACDNKQVIQAASASEALKNEISTVHTMISIEPILEEITFDGFQVFDWVIVGAETGNRKSKIIPKEDWILMIEYNSTAPVFEKESLRGINTYHLCQQYPEDIIPTRKCPKCGKLPNVDRNHHGWYAICKKGCNGEYKSGIRIFESRSEAVSWWNNLNKKVKK
jgi:protein gp37